jgi:hypothetical protein
MNCSRSCCAAALIFTSLLNLSCVSSYMMVNPYTFQTGRTSGTQHARVRAHAGAMPLIHAHDEPLDVHTDQATLDLGSGVSLGVAERSDLGADFQVGFGAGGGGRLYLLQQITSCEDQWAVSVMPAFGWGIGTSSSDGEGNKMHSYQIGWELHAPCSYRISRMADWIFEPMLLNLYYRAPYTAGAQNTHEPSATLKRAYTWPGLASGFRIGVLMVEGSILWMENKPRINAALAIVTR